MRGSRPARPRQSFNDRREAEPVALRAGCAALGAATARLRQPYNDRITVPPAFRRLSTARSDCAGLLG